LSDRIFWFETGRAIVASLIHHSAASDWTLQGLGMFRLDIVDLSRRLHVWVPSMFARKNVTTIHTHPWHFNSTIVAGALRNRLFTELTKPEDRQRGALYSKLEIVCGPGGGPSGRPRVDTSLFCHNEFSYHAGETYELWSHEIHETIPEDGTVTIIERRFPEEPGVWGALRVVPLPDTPRPHHAHVFFPTGIEWVSAEPRPATEDEVLEMKKIARRSLSS
jgi:hypothetical protein